VGVINLCLEAGVRPTLGLILGVEVDAGVGLGEGLDLRPENKVLEVSISNVTGVEQVRARPINDNVAVLDRDGLRVLGVDLPAL